MDGFASQYLADWVLPISGPPIARGAVLVDEHGRIAGIGPARDSPAPPGVPTVDLGAAALLPGLVNTHAHPELACFRGLLEDLTFPAWIGRLMQAKRAVSDLDYEAAAEWSCAEALAAGITTLAATEDSGASLGALQRAGMRGIVFREVFGPDPSRAADAIAELARKLDTMRRVATDLVRVGISPHAPYTVSDALYRESTRLAGAEALPLATHIAESDAEWALVTRGAGSFAEGLRARGIATERRAASPVELLEKLGVLALRPLLIHCVQLGPGDISRIADAGATVAHCPTANARLGHGTAPLLQFLDAGIAVGLGTDSVASNNRQDLLEEARTSQLLQRAMVREPRVLSAEQALRLATLGGATALGLADRVGTLEPGTDADLAAFALGAPHVTPVHDPAAAVLHAVRGTDCILTVVRGRIVYDQNGWHTLDVSSLRARVEREGRKLSAVLSRAEGPTLRPGLAAS
ncbi:MAG: amidohydrolase family protein [Longimicrobiales bacterium]